MTALPHPSDSPSSSEIKAVSICYRVEARTALSTLVDGLAISLTMRIGHLHKRRKKKPSSGAQTVVIYSVKMVRNKLLKDWQNWRPMASRISPEFEAIFCNSLKHKEPGFSSPYKTSGGLLSVDLNRLCLIVSTPAYISRHILQPEELRIH